MRQTPSKVPHRSSTGLFFLECLLFLAFLVPCTNALSPELAVVAATEVGKLLLLSGSWWGFSAEAFGSIQRLSMGRGHFCGVTYQRFGMSRLPFYQRAFGASASYSCVSFQACLARTKICSSCLHAMNRCPVLLGSILKLKGMRQDRWKDWSHQRF